MAIILCPNCGNEISNFAKKCTHCGIVFEEYYAEQERIQQEEKRKAEEERIRLEEIERRKQPCPECRNMVLFSDGTCPHCGFPLNDADAVERAEKAYWNRIEQEKKLAERKQQAEKEKKEQEKQAEIDRLSKPTSLSTYIIALSISLLSTFGLIKSFSSPSFLAALGKGLFIFITPFAWYFFVQLFIWEGNRQDKLYEANRDFDKYVEDERKRKIQLEEARARRAAEEKREWEIAHPICPNCGGRDTQRIKTSKRVVGVATLGIATSTLGKQYECKKCKHKW